MNKIDKGVISYPEGEPTGKEEKPFLITYKNGKTLRGMASGLDNSEWENGVKGSS